MRHCCCAISVLPFSLLCVSLSDRCPDVVVVFSHAVIVVDCCVMRFMPCRSQLLCNAVDAVLP